MSSFPLYTIGDFINQSHCRPTFNIMQFENMAEPQVDAVHKHTFYEVLWIDRGESRQTIDYQTFDIKEHSLFIISPGQLHQFESWQQLRGGVIMFTSDFFLIDQQDRDRLFELSFLDNFYTNPNLKLEEDGYQEIRRTISLMIEEDARRDSSPAILRSLLQVLLLQVQRNADRQTHRSVPKRQIILYKKFKMLVDNRFQQVWRANDYAAKLNITPHHLNRVVKLVTGKTSTEVIRDRSLLEAKRWLIFSDRSVNEIAAALGYFDSSYFAKIFRKSIGHSPLVFRERMSEKYRTK